AASPSAATSATASPPSAAASAAGAAAPSPEFSALFLHAASTSVAAKMASQMGFLKFMERSLEVDEGADPDESRRSDRRVGRFRCWPHTPLTRQFARTLFVSSRARTSPDDEPVAR